MAAPDVRASQKAFRLPRALEILLGVVVVLELVAPFTSTTFGVDGSYHLHWLSEFTDLIAHGVWIPHWIPGAYFGFGAPSFYYYPPLTYYLGSIFRMVFGITDPRWLFQLTGLLATIASFASARLLFGVFSTSSYQKNIGALLYAFAPLRIADLYSRSNLSAHVSYVFVPFVWYGILLFFKPGTRQRNALLVFSGSIACLLLTNIPIFLLTISGIVLAAFMYRKQLRFSIVRNAMVAVLLAMGLTAFYWSSILSFRNDANLGDLLLVQPDYIILYIIHGSGIPAAYHIALLVGVCIELIATVLKARKNRIALSVSERRIALLLEVFCVIMIFLNIPVISVPFWRFLPPLPLIQDAWRMYSVIVLLIAAMIASATSLPIQKTARNIIWLWVLGAILPVFLVVFNTHFYTHYDRSADVATEYLPTYAVPRTQVMSTMKDHAGEPLAMSVLSGEERIALKSMDPRSETFHVQLSHPTPVIFHRFFWKGWHLYVHNNIMEDSPDSLGRATAVLPAGNYVAVWKLEPSNLERAGLIITGLSIVGVLAMVGTCFFAKFTWKGGVE